MGFRNGAARLTLAVTALMAAVVAAVPSAPAVGRHADAAPRGDATGGGRANDADPLAELGRQPVQVTLVTGDRVTVTRLAGEPTTGVEPGPGRHGVRFSIQRAGEHLYVMPDDAARLVAEGRVDRRLFDVAGLVAGGYDDAHRADVPLILRPETPGSREATDAAPPPVPQEAVTGAGAVATELPSVGATVVRQPKDRATELWQQVVTPTGNEGGSAPHSLDTGIGQMWLDGIRHTTLDESVPRIGAPQAWAAGHTGAGVRVAVLDTGIDVTHPDLADRVVATENFTDETDPDDLYGHGTHVASILGGTGAASGDRYRGTAPDAALLNGKVCDSSGSCFDSDILAGMEWAVGSGARVVNLSLGAPNGPEIDPLEAAIDVLSAQHGTLFVVAAGNSGPDAGTVESPGSADAALTVGAVDGADQPADFSSRGPRAGDAALKPEITAPGVDIVAAGARNGQIGEPADDGYVSLSGTSMATPHVAGAAALVAQQHPDWTGAQLKALLVGSARPTAGVDAFAQGSGRLDVARAVGQAVVAEPAVVSVGRPAWPHDDDEPVTRAVAYRNLGSAPVTLALDLTASGPDGDVPAGMFALGTDTVVVPAGGEAAVDVTVDSSVAATDGHHSAWVTATDATAGGDDTAGDEAVVTTPVAVDVEPESHDLTIAVRDRHGSPTGDYQTFLVGLDQELLDLPYDPDGTVSVRLPRGGYAVTGVIASEPPYAALLTQPRVELDRDVTVELDARRARPVDVTVENSAARVADASVSFWVQGEATRFESTTFVVVGGSGRLDGFSTGHVGPDLPDEVTASSFQGTWAPPDEHGGFARSELVYELAWFDQGRMLTGLDRRVRDADLARVESDYRGPGEGAVSAPLAIAQPTGGRPVSVGWIQHGMRLPFRRTQLHNTGGVEWRLGLVQEVADEQGLPFDFQSFHETDPRRLRPRTTYHDTWNRGVLGPAVSSTSLYCTGGGVSRRSGDVLTVAVSTLGDGAGHPGCDWRQTGVVRLSRDGEIIGEVPDPVGAHDFEVPTEAGDYLLEVEATRPPGAPASTHVTAAWSFRSDHVDGDQPEALPLLAVRLAPSLDRRNRVPAGGRLRIPVHIERLGDMGPAREVSADASFDDGATWHPVTVQPISGGRFVALVDQPDRAGFVSLRAHASDSRGNAVTQTIIRAYEMTAPDA